jgi:flagellar hook-associated protein 2
MAAPITFSGLASGLDSSSIISSIVAVAKAQDSTLTTQQTNITAQEGIVTDISNKVSSLGLLAQEMTLTSDVALRAGTTSDSHVSVAVSNSAIATTHDIRVAQLAQAQVVSSRTFSSNTAGVLGVGGVTITTGSGTPASVTWDNTDTLSTIAQKINSTGSALSASVLYDGSSYRLVMTDNSSGQANASTFADTGDGLDLSDPTNIKIPAQDAKVSVDGVMVTRPTNIIDDAIPGVTLTAVSPQGTSDPDTSVAVSVDKTGIGNKLQSFVDAYNTVNAALNAQLTYTGTAPGANTLFGDSTLRELQGSLQSMMTSFYGSTSLDTIGMSMDTTGVMTLDTDKLGTALDNDPHAVDSLFATAKGGFAKAVSNLSTLYTETGDGIFADKTTAMDDRKTILQTQIDQIDANATAMQTRLESEYSALESTISSLKTEGNYLTSVFSTSSSASSTSSNSTSSSSSSA